MLVVEDDPGYGPLISRMLRDGSYEPLLTRTAGEARAAAAEHPYRLAVVDINLPDGSGLELIGWLGAERPETAIVVASGVSDAEIAGSATELGAYGYLVKPFDRNQLLITLEGALHRRELELADRLRERSLEETVARRTRELRTAVTEISISRRETIGRLMRALEMRDGETGAHVERIGLLAEALATWAGLEDDRARTVGLAARMHDIGKIGVPDSVLLKQGPLEPGERREIEKHTEIGRQILFGSDTQLLRVAESVAATHHEWYDGSGYPEGLRGDQIPLEGRIAAIVDVFDALHSERCYRPALNSGEALEVMLEGRGNHFDPVLLDTFMEHYEEAMELIGRTSGAGI